MSEEREALLQQMGQMEAELRVLRKATKSKGSEEDGGEPRAISNRSPYCAVLTPDSACHRTPTPFCHCRFPT